MRAFINSRLLSVQAKYYCAVLLQFESERACKMLVVAVVALVPLLFLIFQMIKKTIIFPGSSEKLPPGPNTWQILRKAFELRKDSRTALRGLARIYGPLMTLRLGSQVVIIASSAATAREVLQTQDRNFSGRFIPWALYGVPQLTEASIAMSGECNNNWKFFRGMGHSFIFSSKSIESKAGLRKAKAVELVKYLQGKQGRAVQLDGSIISTIHNIISNMLVSRNIYDITGGDDENDENMRAAIHAVIEIAYSSVGFSDLFPLLRKIDFWSKRKAMGIYTSTVYMWADVVKERRSIRSQRLAGDDNYIGGDFLDVLLDNALPDDQIYVILTEILIGSTHTSAVVSTWLMAELIKNPHILRRVADEVAEAFDDDDMMRINESILTESEYLQACIKETLRLHNPGPLTMPHRAIETCKIDNYVIPKDSIVVVHGEAIGLDPESWKDGDKFDPDRFVGSNIDYRGTHFQFIPFGAGRRICPGFNVAFKNIQIVVASLVHCFDWSIPDLDDTVDMSERFIYGVLQKEKPLHLIPKSIR